MQTPLKENLLSDLKAFTLADGARHEQCPAEGLERDRGGAAGKWSAGFHQVSATGCDLGHQAPKHPMLGSKLYEPGARVVPWYTIFNPLPEGRREFVVRLKCADDAHAADDLSADMFPGAEVWEGARFVAALPREGFPRGQQGDDVVTVRPGCRIASEARLLPIWSRRR
jgi:hypothetical protein